MLRFIQPTVEITHYQFTEHAHHIVVQIKRSLLTPYKKAKFSFYEVTRGRKMTEDSTITLYTLTFPVLSFDGVKCQDRLLIPDWI